MDSTDVHTQPNNKVEVTPLSRPRHSVLLLSPRSPDGIICVGSLVDSSGSRF